MADYDDGYDDGPQVVAPSDERAAAILDGFRMCARSCPDPPPKILIPRE